ncbi:MAG: hypothetical protein A2252_05670 [Elusimicrobia bacterium RIFOXYA2_FULL_39_19]|nr:MAG: hypothetical protein A2252_05670 [Elusimicrobia bacterium RIFOXYA2_FULL_39_19]
MKINIILPFFFTAFIAAMLNCAPKTSASETLQNIIEQNKNITVDFSSLKYFYDTLPVDEKEEQLRDWAFSALLARLNVPQKKINELFKNSTPMRFQSRKDTGKYAIAPGRMEYLSKSDAVILIPIEKNKDKNIVSFLADKKFASTNTIPEKIHIFGYNLNTNSADLTVTFLKTEPGKTVFSETYGCFTKEVKNLNDFKQFMLNCDDILSMQWNKDTLTFKARKYSGETGRALNAEDIAVLYQAYIPQVTPAKEEKHKHDYNMFVNNKYDEILRLNPKLKRSINAGQAKKADIMAYIREKIPYRSLEEGDDNIGFSLDPGMDYASLADDILKLTQLDTNYVNPEDAEMTALVSSLKNELSQTAEKIRKQSSTEPLLVILRKYSNSQQNTQARFCDLLKRIEKDSSYQTARYDGNLKGTMPAMVLFYTDLTAKFWALDYNGLTPKTISGFKTMPEISIPKQYWEDFLKLSKTRLWFGVRKESFEVYGTKAVFEPIATRVYAASSDPLFPGKESKPNYQSKEFLGWWDLHYSAVADNEPQYHKLNQIQKWSCLLMILKEEKNHTLDFLFDVPAQRDLNFETWYKDTQSLKYKTNIAFLDRSKFGRETECMPLFTSRDYPLMGKGFFLFGGVSLASKNDILGKLNRKTGIKTSPPAKKPQPAVKSNRIGPPLKKAKIHSVENLSEAPGKTFSPAPLVLENKPEVTLNCKMDKINYGNLLIEKDTKTVRLKFVKDTGTIVEEVLGTLAKLQEAHIVGFNDERLFKKVPEIENVVKISSWKTYLLKCRQIKSGMIYLKINEKEKNTVYGAVFSGTEPDSDIFYAKLLTQTQADTLLKTQNPKP